MMIFYYDDVKKQPFANMWVSPADGYFRFVVMSKAEFQSLIQTDVKQYNYFSSFKDYQAYLNYVKKEYIYK
nr:hypothetical protein [uncultured Moraxella sp.]